ncbi:MAG: hypothetical protein IJ574_01225 [Bacilli bacterium]|nr:hypothetical protein [Bacilli bacterium]
MKKNKLVKVIGVIAILAIIMTWIFHTGSFSGTTFQDMDLKRIGFSDIPVLLYYAIYFSLDKIVYLIFLAGCYGVLNRTTGYQKLVVTLAKKIEDKKKIFIPIISLIIVVLTALLTQTLALLVFVPFLISVLLRSGTTKLQAFATIFGSMIVGMIAPIYGTEGLTFFNQYVGGELVSKVWIKVCVLLIAYFLLNFFIIKSLGNKKVTKKDKKKNEVNETKEEDVFEIVEPKGKTKLFPIIIVGCLFIIVVILGFINWNNFNISWFNEMHEKVLGVTLGKNDFAIFTNILGGANQAFGSFDLLTLAMVFLIAVILIAFMYKVKFSEFIEAFGEGLKKFMKPTGVVALCYFVFAIVYNSAIMPYITSKILVEGSKFSSIKVTLIAMLTNVFHIDLGYTGYSIGSYLTALYPDKIEALTFIYVSVYGLLSFIIPNSILLAFGLSYLDIDYSSWIKYIWKFVLIMLVVLLIVILAIL